MKMFDKEATQLGTFIIYISSIINIAISLTKPSISKYFLYEISFYIINIFLAYRIKFGGNWARSVLTISFLLCVPFFLGPISRELSRYSFFGISKFLLLCILCYSITLLFRKIDNIK